MKPQLIPIWRVLDYSLTYLIASLQIDSARRRLGRVIATSLAGLCGLLISLLGAELRSGLQ